MYVPYIDLRAERARICAEKGCNPFDAQELILVRLEEGAYWPLRWSPNPGGRPPRGGELWYEDRVLINWDTGEVFDDFDMVARERRSILEMSPAPYRTPEWRTLLLWCPPASEAEAAPQHEPVQPGPKPEANPQVVPVAQPANLQVTAWRVAEGLLNRQRDEPDPNRADNGQLVAPPPGRGRKTTLARMVGAKLRNLGHSVQDETVRKYISPSVEEWERKNFGR